MGNIVSTAKASGAETEVTSPVPETKSSNNLLAIDFISPHAEGLLSSTPGSRTNVNTKTVPESPSAIKVIDTAAVSGFKDEITYPTSTLRKTSKIYEFDPNLPIEELDAVDAALKNGKEEKAIGEVAEERELLVEDSPYPEVRAAVRATDVPSLPASTIRAWTIGLLLTTLGSGINCLFSLRNPSIALNTYAIQLLAYPLGLGWDLLFPDHVFTIPFSLPFTTTKITFNFRPGRFNYKEHTIIVVMANAAYAGGAIYATDVLVSQQVFYGQSFGWAFQLLFAITNQMMGYGLAGVCRRWLVWPAAMIWPANLVNCALMYTLHDHSPSDPSLTNGWQLSRYKWFLYVLIGSFGWYWFPGWIFQGLSYFTFACWIAPKNVVVNQIFGGVTGISAIGLGLISITFDWTMITGFLGSPLIPPWFAIGNAMFGLLIFFICVPLGIHYTGAWYADYFPMQDSRSYDNTGHRYNVSKILDSKLEFNEDLYKAYSPIFLSTNFALCYGLAFAAISAVIVHTILYERKTIVRQWKQARDQEDDIHMKLMKNYTDAPDWWYALLFVVMLALSFFVILYWDTHFTWYAIIVCILIPIIWVVPVGIIFATTNVQIGLNVITEFIVGYMTPGRPLAMMMFKSYGYIVMVQAQYFLQDLKLGHYLKVPPKTMFWAQSIATLWSSIIQIAVMNWALNHIPEICTSTQKNSYTCPGGNVFFTASVIWGAIGPKRIFSPGAIYSPLLWYFLIGAALPVITFLIVKRWPGSMARYICVPVMFGGLGAIPPATVYNYLLWGITGFVFQRLIRRRFLGWWSQYNYVTSAALDCGLILCTLFIFFTLQITNQKPPQWFGNVAVFETLDQTDKAVRKQVPLGETIGPKTWA